MLKAGIAKSSASTPMTMREAERSERRWPTRERFGGVVHHLLFLFLFLLLLLWRKEEAEMEPDDMDPPAADANEPAEIDPPGTPATAPPASSLSKLAFSWCAT